MKLGVFFLFTGKLRLFECVGEIEFDKNANSASLVHGYALFHIELVWRLSEFAFLATTSVVAFFNEKFRRICK